MQNEDLAKIIDIFAETLEKSYSDEYVIMVVAKRPDGSIIHAYEMGDSVKPRDFCQMAMECIIALYGDKQGWKRPDYE